MYYIIPLPTVVDLDILNGNKGLKWVGGGRVNSLN